MYKKTDLWILDVSVVMKSHYPISNLTLVQCSQRECFKLKSFSKVAYGFFLRLVPIWPNFLRLVCKMCS